MTPKFKLALKIFSNILVSLVVLFCVTLYAPRLFGLTPYSVLSGSMQSVYPTGSLIYITDVHPDELKIRDIITFKMSNGAIATHRIIEFVQDENSPDITRFRTKGDENEIADGTLVEHRDVIGKPVFCIPILGYIVTYISSPPGKYIVAAVAISLILIELIIAFIVGDKENNKYESK